MDRLPLLQRGGDGRWQERVYVCCACTGMLSRRNQGGLQVIVAHVAAGAAAPPAAQAQELGMASTHGQVHAGLLTAAEGDPHHGVCAFGRHTGATRIYHLVVFVLVSDPPDGCFSHHLVMPQAARCSSIFHAPK